MKTGTRITAVLLLGGSLLLAACDGGVNGGGKDAAEVAETAVPERVFWGDTHLHTSNSVDAFGFGVRLDPEAALRFAKGEEVTATTGMKAKLARPLDFLVITDHSDALGGTKALAEAPRMLITDPTMQRWHDLLNGGPEKSMQATAEIIDARAHNRIPAAMADDKAAAERNKSIWNDHITTVDDYNEPGKFTAMLGFEFTLMNGGRNLHRNVIFRDGGDKVRSVVPLGAWGANVSAASLWDYMDAYEKATGGKVLAIPHNSNLSNGQMFELTMPGGGPMTADYARRRAAREPLVEVTQIKGDSEAHPFLSPNDEFAGFGVAGWEMGDLAMAEDKRPNMFAGEYIREALKRGLLLEGQTGANPYRQPHRTGHGGRRQLLWQAYRNRTQRAARLRPAESRHPRGTNGLALSGRRLCRCLGQGQYPSGNLGRDGAARGLWHHRPADDRAVLRRLGFCSR
jgi:predicted small secreted protein